MTDFDKMGLAATHTDAFGPNVDQAH